MLADVLVIVNPRAQSGGAAGRDRALIAARLKALPNVAAVEWSVTDHPGHATDIAKEAADAGVRYVFAAGGDGTISEVVNGLMQSTHRPIFGVLPWGTLNDFYRALVDAERTLPADQANIRLDIGRVQVDSLERYCCLSISAGLSSWANMQYQQAARRFGRILGAIPAVLNTLLKYRRTPAILLRLDEQPPNRRRMLALAIGNAATVGGGVRLTPDAKIDDGRFDLSIIKEISLWRLAFVLIGARLVRHYRSRALEQFQAQRMSITSARPITINIDGEPLPLPGSQASSLSVTVLAATLQVVRPSLVTEIQITQRKALR